MFINKKAFYTQEGNTMARQFRRVVTGHNPEGKSIILMDGAPPQVLEPIPQLFLHEIWETSAPADNTGQTDTAIRDPRIEPMIQLVQYSVMLSFPLMNCFKIRM